MLQMATLPPYASQWKYSINIFVIMLKYVCFTFHEGSLLPSLLKPRVQTKPVYQEPERNQEVELFQKQEPKRNQEYQNLRINNWN